MNRIVVSKEFDPAYNLALEEELLKNIKDNEVILYLWQNDKTVVIGRNQNPYSECNLEYMKMNDITLVRRISGGGAVFHDLGNINFTFLTKEANVNLDKQLKVIKNAVSALGLQVEISGRNDLVTGDKKFSGHAFYSEDGNYFHHGTLMIDIDIDNLSKALNPSKIKLRSKGIRSVRSRVVNLKELNNRIDIQMVTRTLISSFTDVYGQVNSIKAYDRENYVPIFYRKYTQSKWNYGECPEFDICLEKKISIGNIEVNINVKSGIITECKIFTDSILKVDISIIEVDVKGLIFIEEEVMEFIEKKFENEILISKNPLDILNDKTIELKTELSIE